MLTFDTTSLPLVTAENVGDLSSGSSIYFHAYFEDNASASGGIMASYDNRFIVFVYPYDGTNYFLLIHAGSGTTGQFLVAYPVSGHMQVVITYEFSSTPSIPIVYINGVQQDIVVAAAPDGAYDITSQQWVFGGVATTSLSYALNGSIGELAFFAGTTLTSNEAVQLTKSRLMRMPLQYSSCTNYWALDEIRDGVSYSTAGADIVAAGDVVTPWSTDLPHYDKINISDEVYLVASPDDDNEEEQFTCSSDTIPEGREIECILETIKGYDAGGFVSSPLTSKISYNSGETSTETVTFVADTLSYVLFFVSDVSQDDLDSLNLHLTTGTFGTTSTVSIDKITINLYYASCTIRDYLSSSNSLRGPCTAVGFAQNYLSYA